MAISEIFVSVTGLEFAYSVSPDRLKSFIMAAYLLTIAKGDFMFGVFYSTIFRDFNRAMTLHIFSLMMLFNLASYGYVVRLWELRHGLVSWDLFDKVLNNESDRILSQSEQYLSESSQQRRTSQRRGKILKDQLGLQEPPISHVRRR